FDSDSNAYYTDYYLASGIWQAMIDNGFQGGRVAETSAGTGRFILTIPPDIAGNVELTAIEREHSSGQILHHLYGDTADVRISPYEKVFLPDETFDLAIGNIPFGDIKIFDRKEFGPKAELVHDYFMLRTLKKLKHGGVQAFITSTGTLDKKDDRVRREIAKSADLVGVIRLPRGVLKETAGTDVSMDVLVFRKRYPGEEPGGMPFQKVVPISVKAKTRVTVKEEATTYHIGETLELPVNEALANRPELAGGEFVAVSGRFGPELATVFSQQEGDETFDLRTGVRGLLNTLSDVLPDDLFSRKPDGAAVSADEEGIVEDESRIVGRREARAMVVQGFFIGDDGKVHVLTNLVEEVDPESGSRSWRTYSHVLALKPNDEARVKALVILRDQVRAHLMKESDPASDEESVEESRRLLNESYDSFVADFGYINGRLNRKWVMEDAAAASLLGLESWDEDKGVATKADIMSRRVVAPAKPKDSASSLREAAVISFGQSGRINLDHVARLLNLSSDELNEQIEHSQDLFFDPGSNQWQIRETYLSGNVRTKHEQAQSAAKMDNRYERNVAALAEVVPDYIPIDDIYVNLGSTWTSTDLYRDFTLSLLDGSKLTDVTIQFIPLLGQWDVKFADHLKSRYAAQMMEIYGTEKFPLDKVLGSALSGRPPVITYELEGERVKDVEQSLQAQIKVDELKEAFRSWLQGQEGWKQRLEKEYNNRFNCYNWIDYDASDFDFPGLSPLWEPRPHQRSVVLRGLMEGNLLVAHCVGAGKTMEQAMMLMEAKRLGLLNKPVLTVPNHLLFQAAGAVKSYYPQSNICIVNKDDLATKDKRRAFVAKVAMNDWDMVVITHSMLKKIQVPLETEVEITSELVDEYQYMLAMVKQLSSREGGRSYSERTIFKKVSEERDRLKELVERLESGADNDLNMRELGIDGLAVD
ncbi:MAG: hypothetical protein EP334_00430, partial [Gammaproteobacteria bacterium]